MNSALTVWLEAAAAVLRNWKRQLPIRRWLKTWKQLTPGGSRLRCRQPLQSSAVGKSAAGAAAVAGKGRCNHKPVSYVLPFKLETYLANVQVISYHARFFTKGQHIANMW